MGRVLKHLLLFIAFLVPADGVSLGLLKRLPTIQAATPLYCSVTVNDQVCGTFTNDPTCSPSLETQLTSIANSGPSSIPSTGVPGGTGGCFYATNDQISAVCQPSLATVVTVRLEALVLSRHN